MGVWLFLLLIVGCADGPQLRLHTLLGVQIDTELSRDSAWPNVERIGLMVHSDETGPGAAPAVSSEFLETLSRRTEQFLIQRCQVGSVTPLPVPRSGQQGYIQQELIGDAQEYGISHAVLVVFSSREHASPVTLGEERMMTQLSGISIENQALAEVAVLRLEGFRVEMTLIGEARETLELLDAPIGEGGPSRVESLDILRAQAAQQALDRTLHNLGERCEGIPEKA